MTEQVAPDSPDASIVRRTLHGLLLCAAMVAPYFLFEPRPASLVSGMAGIVYLFLFTGLIPALWSEIRDLWKEGGEPGAPWTVALVVIGFEVSVMCMAVGVMIAQVMGWAYWAYDDEFWKTSGPMGWLKPVLLGSLILVPALFLRFAPAFGRKHGRPASQLLKCIRDQGFGHLHRVWLGAIAMVLALACLGNILVTVGSAHGLETARTNGDAVAIWDLAIAFPYLPASLLTAVVMLLASGLSTLWEANGIEVLARTYRDGDPVAPAPGRRPNRALGLTVAGGWAATLFAILYQIHLGAVAANFSVVGLIPLIRTAQAVTAWVPAQREAGRSTAEIAAELNRTGSWSSDAPDTGLATLVEDPGRVFAEACSVRIAAGLTDPSSHRSFGWLPAEQAVSDLKYCIAVSCDTALPWNTPPALMLWSSHDSRAAYWRHSWTIDLFAEGAAAAPGGYCTIDGRLADRFQG